MTEHREIIFARVVAKVSREYLKQGLWWMESKAWEENGSMGVKRKVFFAGK